MRTACAKPHPQPPYPHTHARANQFDCHSHPQSDGSLQRPSHAKSSSKDEDMEDYDDCSPSVTTVTPGSEQQLQQQQIRRPAPHSGTSGSQPPPPLPPPQEQQAGLWAHRNAAVALTSPGVLPQSAPALEPQPQSALQMQKRPGAATQLTQQGGVPEAQIAQQLLLSMVLRSAERALAAPLPAPAAAPPLLTAAEQVALPAADAAAGTMQQLKSLVSATTMAIEAATQLPAAVAASQGAGLPSRTSSLAEQLLRLMQARRLEEALPAAHHLQQCIAQQLTASQQRPLWAHSQAQT